MKHQSLANMLPALFVLLIYLSRSVIGQCEEGWYQYRAKCFSVRLFNNYQHVSWDYARGLCLQSGGDLGSIHSSEENEFLVAYPLSDRRYPIWIGLRYEEKSGRHVWSDGTPVNFVNWDENEPTLTDGNVKKNCVHLRFNPSSARSGKTGKWFDSDCKSGGFYLCQKPTDPTLSNPKYCSDANGGGYQFQSSCYHYINTPMTWTASEEFCQSSYDGNLVSIRDNGVNMYMNDLMKELNIVSPVWIGIKATGRAKPQKWSSGWLLLYEKWIDGFFQNQLRIGDCAVRLRSGTWNVRPCDRKFAFLCEISTERPLKLESSVEGSFCPAEPPVWRDFGGDYCYYHNDAVTTTWLEAHFECKRNGGSLASIHSQAEMFIFYHFFQDKNIDEMFIGLFKKHGGDWAWMDGSKVDYLRNINTAPYSEKEGCIVLKAATILWDVIACSANGAYLCSTKKIPPNVTIIEEEAVCSGELLNFE